ncbi:MAG TPA: glycosyl hydrolase, partial [Candidatus Saccharimonadia bacterium]|nr:glycosyl hydrolase [Candidatus Saccharimonadia bacterium]
MSTPSTIALATMALALCLSVPGAAARPAAERPAAEAARWDAWRAHEALERSSPFHGLKWRSIGPTVQGGRVVDVESIPGNPYGFYVAYATGGVWKTTNNGVAFEPLTDALATMVIGDIAVDPNAPQRLWVGTGEPNSSRSSYGGLGIYRSDDGGRTFAHRGLGQTDRIGRVVVDPRDGDHVCVAALGRLYTTGGERGVFCTRDAGESWKNTLPPANEWTGAVDLVIDPRDPDVMYAATWERSRAPWNFVEAGSGSAVHKSTDGGDTWTRLAGTLPSNDKVGRIGLALAASNPDVVYAVIDNWTPLPRELVDYGDRPLNLKRLKAMSKEEFLRQDPEEIEGFIRDADLDNAIDAKTLVT